MLYFTRNLRNSACALKTPVDSPRAAPFPLRLFHMTTPEQQTPAQPQQQSLTPEKFPFTEPQLMNRYVTDTGKILPRKWTHLTSKQQRRVTSTIKRSRNMLLAP